MKDFDVKNWCDQVSRARERIIPNSTVLDIVNLFSDACGLDDLSIKRVFEELLDNPAEAKFVFSYCQRRRRELLQEKQRAASNRERWEAKRDCVTPNQWSWFFKLLGLTMQMHQRGMYKTDASPGTTDAVDIDEWNRRGRPKTWSPVIDNLLVGMHKTIDDDNAFENYLHRFYDELKTIKTSHESV